MTFFSRCEVSQRFEPALRSSPSRRVREHAAEGRFRQAFAGFAEDIGILFRYAAGLDYYGRGRVGLNR